ncbi:MAG TPA: hypothetical protein V6D17_03985 [Candidatus Obscuribacterales bacterium]
MKINATTTSNVKEAVARLALSLTLAVVASGQIISSASPAHAQMESLSQLHGLSADQESLLPPEVVPLDPQAAAKLAETQSTARQMSPPFDQPAPGLSGSESQSGGQMQSVREFRQQAFNNLMGKEELWKQANSNQQVPGLAPLQPMSGATMGTITPQSGAPGLGQPAPMQGQQPQLGLSPWQTPQSLASANSLPAQTQTLSGGVKKSPVKGIARTGFSHAVSGLVGFGAGAYSAFALRSRPMALYSLGIMGVGMGNYALRNGFRF